MRVGKNITWRRDGGNTNQCALYAVFVIVCEKGWAPERTNLPSVFYLKGESGQSSLFSDRTHDNAAPLCEMNQKTDPRER